jgi:hypothetical protein
MDFQEVVSSLTEDQKGAVLAAIEAEKTRGIEAANKKGAENAKLRRENEGFKSAIKNTFEFDVTSVDELPDVLSKFKTKTVNTSEYVPVKDFELLKKQIADRVARIEQGNRELRNSKTAEKLNKVIGDQFHASDYLIKDLIAGEKVRLTESGDVVFVDGEDEVDITKGIERLKKNRPDLVKNLSKPGSGGAGGGKDKGSKTISLEEFNNLPGIERAKLMADGYKLT